MGVGTRTQVKDMLKKGLVTVDDIINIYKAAY